MSFESPPQTPNESERIDDTEKAEEMARSSDFQRKYEARAKKSSEDEKWTPEKKEEFKAQSEHWGERAEQEEEKAAIEYDTRKEVEGLGDDEVRALREKIWQEAGDAYGESRRLQEALASPEERIKQVLIKGEERGVIPSEESLKEAIEKAEDKWWRLNHKRFVLDKILRERGVK